MNRPPSHKCIVTLDIGRGPGSSFTDNLSHPMDVENASGRWIPVWNAWPLAQPTQHKDDR